MASNIGLTRFSTKGPMEYLLTSGEWLLDTDLYSGAPVQLFGGKAAALLRAEQFPKKERPHWVEFQIDGNGKVIAF